MERITAGGGNLSFPTRRFGQATIVTSPYRHGNKLAVELVAEDGEPIAVLSVNLPEFSHLLDENEFFVKTWEENEGIAADAFASGLFWDTGRRSGGILEAKIWKMR